MNQLLYLFESLKSLSDETALLEACDWCDERFKVVSESFSQAVTESLSESNQIKDTKGLIETVKFKLTSTLSEKEVNACLHILEDNIKRFLLLNHEVNYEN